MAKTLRILKTYSGGIHEENVTSVTSIHKTLWHNYLKGYVLAERNVT